MSRPTTTKAARAPLRPGGETVAQRGTARSSRALGVDPGLACPSVRRQGLGRPGDSRRALWLLAALILLPQSSLLAASDVGRSEPARLAVKVVAPDAGEDGGRAALGAAAAEREAAYKLGGEAREAGLIRAAATFGALADDAETAIAVRAEAAFRAGELLRARKLPEEAAARFHQALTVGGALPAPRLPTAGAAGGSDAGADAPLGGPLEPGVIEARGFAARGLLELAHLERRADRFDEALSLYGRLSGDFPDQPRQGAHGGTWAIKLLVRAGSLDEAKASVADFAAHHQGYPLELLRNTTTVAEALMDAGRQSEAQALVEATALQLEPLMDTEDSQLKTALSAVRVTVRDRVR